MSGNAPDWLRPEWWCSYVDPMATISPASAIYLAADSQPSGGVTPLSADIRGSTVPAGVAADLLPTFLALDKPGAVSVCQLVDSPPGSADATAQLTSTNTGRASAAAGCALIAGPITIPP